LVWRKFVPSLAPSREWLTRSAPGREQIIPHSEFRNPHFLLFPTDGVAIPRMKARQSKSAGIFSIRGSATPSVGHLFVVAFEAFGGQARFLGTGKILAQFYGSFGMPRRRR
jgi:hypothetical protein